MDNKSFLHSGVKKIAATVITQALILGLSIITGFILPKKMGPEMYGYWQIYIFYLAYLNLFGLGFNDGIALYYGGYEYKNLPFDRLRSALRIFAIYIIVLTGILFFIVSQTNSDIQRGIYQVLTFSVPLICLQCIILTVFLSVNRTAIYNSVNFLTKAAATVLYLVLIFAGFTSFKLIMYADFLVRFLSTVICIILGRQFIFGKVTALRTGADEFIEKSKSGIKITIAIIASSLIPVSGRMIIEWNEPISVYGMYSFAMSLLMIIIIFTSTAGTVIFPLLKKLETEKLLDYYPRFSFVCNSLIYIALLAYIPSLYIIRNYMLEYIPVLKYLHILLIMCLPLGKMQLLITPYFKAKRLEKAFLIANGLGMLAMIIFTAVSYQIFHSVTAVAICSTVVLTVWTVLTEINLLKKLGSSLNINNLFIELLMMISFVIGGCFINIFFFSAVYGGALIIYFICYRKQIKVVFEQFKHKR